MGDLEENLPYLAENVHMEGISCSRKHMEVKDNETEGPQDVLNAENFEDFKSGIILSRFPLLGCKRCQRA